MGQFKRRHFLISSGAMLVSRVASGQAPARKLGFLSLNPPPNAEENSRSVFLAKLKQRGWVEGQNLLIVRAYADLKRDRLPAMAEDLVRQRVEVIVAQGAESAVAASRATTTIPIVFGFVAWPIEMGLIESYAKPGRNATGRSSYTGTEVSNKRHEFLREIAPAAKRLSWIFTPDISRHVQGGTYDVPVEPETRKLGYEPKYHTVQKTEDLEAVFSEIVAFRAQALSVAGSAVLFSARQQIADFALKNRLPSASIMSSFVEAGGLLSYSAAGEPSATLERIAEYADRILRGARPADLPVERPSSYELVINLKTAKMLGLKIPPSVLLRADRVIE